jgi:histidinol phosphatase-like enzyme
LGAWRFDPHKTIFFDRDGTLIEYVGILKDPDDIWLFLDTIEALRELHKNYLLFVVTNQPVVSQWKLSLG